MKLFRWLEELDRSGGRTGWGTAILVFLVAAIVLAILLPVYRSTHEAELAGIALGNGDQARYMRMADAPFRFLEVPYGYRILSPLIVSLLPTDHPTGFMILTVVSIAATAALLHQYIASVLGRGALFGVLLFLVSPVARFAVEHPFIVDPLAYFFVTLAFLLIARGSWRLLAVALGVGLFAKESVAFPLAPTAAIAAFRHRLRPIVLWGMVFGLPIASYIAIHRTPLVFGETPPIETDIYLHPTIVAEILEYQQQWASIPQSFVSVLIFSFGALWAVVPLAFRPAPRPLRWSVLYLLPVFGSLLFVYDWKRMLLYGFPVVVPLASVLTFGLGEAIALLLSSAALTYVVADLPASMLKYAIEAALLAVSLASIAQAWRRAGHSLALRTRPRAAGRPA